MGITSVYIGVICFALSIKDFLLLEEGPSANTIFFIHVQNIWKSPLKSMKNY